VSISLKVSMCIPVDDALFSDHQQVVDGFLSYYPVVSVLIHSKSLEAVIRSIMFATDPWRSG